MKEKPEFHFVTQKCVLSGCKHDEESFVESLDFFVEILSSVLPVSVFDYSDYSLTCDLIGQFHLFSFELSTGTH